MKKRTLAGLIGVGFTLSMASSVNATMMTVDLVGRISGKPVAYRDSTPVKVGDQFGLSLAYDDAMQTSRIVSASSGELYTVVTWQLSLDRSKWWGTLPEEIAQTNSELPGTGWGYIESWFRPLTTLHHSEWRITGGAFSSNPTWRGFDFYLVTNYENNLGYGWWSVGSEAYPPTTQLFTVDRGFLDVTSLTIAPMPPRTPVALPVPEPSTYLLLGMSIPLVMLRVKLRPNRG